MTKCCVHATPSFASGHQMCERRSHRTFAPPLHLALPRARLHPRRFLRHQPMTRTGSSVGTGCRAESAQMRLAFMKCRSIAALRAAFVSALLASPAAAQESVLLRLHPRVGDTLHTLLEQQTEVTMPAASAAFVSRSTTTSVTIHSQT